MRPGRRSTALARPFHPDPKPTLNQRRSRTEIGGDTKSLLGAVGSARY
jgi:hypothetical protein